MHHRAIFLFLLTVCCQTTFDQTKLQTVKYGSFITSCFYFVGLILVLDLLLWLQTQLTTLLLPLTKPNNSPAYSFIFCWNDLTSTVMIHDKGLLIIAHIYRRLFRFKEDLITLIVHFSEFSWHDKFKLKVESRGGFISWKSSSMLRRDQSFFILPMSSVNISLKTI